jgi:hypothetical protein
VIGRHGNAAERQQDREHGSASQAAVGDVEGREVLQVNEGHSWHRLTGAYDTAVFSGRRLMPVETGTRRPASEAVLLGMPQRPGGVSD